MILLYYDEMSELNSHSLKRLMPNSIIIDEPTQRRYRNKWEPCGESEKHQRLARMRHRGPDKRGAWWNGKRRW